MLPLNSRERNPGVAYSWYVSARTSAIACGMLIA
jgi:hypothetical protein